MKLNELRDNPGAAKKKVRVGRGPGSGVGKTAGRGIKGQNSRSGVAINGYEGGQMPLYMRLPKRGFNKPNRKEFAVVNLGLIQKFIDAGKIDAAQPITEVVLVQSGVLRRSVTASACSPRARSRPWSRSKLPASAGAVAAVEGPGGSLKVARRRTRTSGVRTGRKPSRHGPPG
jgi:large subunit ribosomal protein L15